MKRFMSAFTIISCMLCFDVSASDNKKKSGGLLNYFFGEEVPISIEKEEHNSSKEKSPRQKNVKFNSNNTNLTNQNNFTPIKREETPPPQRKESQDTISPNEIKKDDKIGPLNPDQGKTEEFKIVMTKEEFIKKTQQSDKSTKPIPKEMRKMIEDLLEEEAINKPIITPTPVNTPTEERRMKQELTEQKIDGVSSISTTISEISQNNTGFTLLPIKEEISLPNNTNKPMSEEKKPVAPKTFWRWMGELGQSQSTPEYFFDLNLKDVVLKFVDYNEELNGFTSEKQILTSQPFKFPETDQEKYEAFLKGQFNVDRPHNAVFKLDDKKYYVSKDSQTGFYKKIEITQESLPVKKGLVFEKRDNGEKIDYHVKSIYISNNNGIINIPPFQQLTSEGFSGSLDPYLAKNSPTFRTDTVIKDENNRTAKTALLYTIKNPQYNIELTMVRNRTPDITGEITDLLSK